MSNFARLERESFFTNQLSYWLSFALVLSFALLVFIVRAHTVQSTVLQAPGWTSYIAHTASPAPTVKKAPKPSVSSRNYKSAVVQKPAAVPACTPSGYGLPSGIALAGKAQGLTEAVDAPEFYTVNGKNGAEVRQQIQQCAPRLMGSTDFTGLTSYRVTWWYQYQSTASGECRVMNAKIGMHINQSLPRLNSDGGNTAFRRDWQMFIANLQTHEQGHVNLDKQYAAKMLAVLQSFPATNCSSIQSAVDHTMSAQVTQLNAVNDSYDAQTNHGATQGAVLPN